MAGEEVEAASVTRSRKRVALRAAEQCSRGWQGMDLGEELFFFFFFKARATACLGADGNIPAGSCRVKMQRREG